VHDLLLLLLQVDHPNCIKLYAVYITGRKVYIVTELVTGGELLDRLVCAKQHVYL
jgi:serine/threonine protein kinase